MTVINTLPSGTKRKVIKIYLDAFRRQETPCPTCVDHCCQGCQGALGYHYDRFTDVRNLPDRITYLQGKYGWTQRPSNPSTYEDWKEKDQGFWQAGKGCRLPYKERSPICVGFTCGKMNDNQRLAGSKIYGALVK